MGNSIFDSIFAHFARTASVAMIDLVLLLLTSQDACICSLELLLFLRGTRVSNLAVDVEGIFPV